MFVDDVAVRQLLAAALHQLRGDLGAKERPLDIDRHLLLPVGERGILQLFDHHDARDVDKDVQLAVLRLDRADQGPHFLASQGGDCGSCNSRVSEESFCRLDARAAQGLGGVNYLPV